MPCNRASIAIVSEPFAETQTEAVEAFAEDIAADEIAISAEVGRLAMEAGARYGKAVGHVADLNFGDCFAYACAKSLGVS